MLRKSLAFVVVALLLAAGASAQSVGLVLSGGGAKGLYHIGVIQALEENEIPIDYVAGTSMGSIIAALYAAGYSPEEMRAIVDSGQVREWVSGRIDSRYASYYRQMQDQPSMLTLRLNLRDEEKRSDAKNKSRLVLPSHLISSSQIDLALAELLTPASTASGGDFDRLMVPFRCVASDLVARKPYVLKTGDLGEAVRASMAIPLAFNPIEKDSMLLYDGGIYDNFPWKPLDETFRPDYLIGSKCTSGNTEPNAKSIMDQVWMLTMEKTDYDMPAGRSTLIERAVDVSMLDFSQADAIIQSGYDDTMALMDSLKSAVPRRMSRGEALRRRAAFRERCPELLFNRYAIEGLNPAQTTYVRDNMQLDHQHDGEPKILSFERVKDKYFSVLADGSPVEGCVARNGRIELPYPAKVVQTGLGFVSALSPLPLESDTQSGSTLGRNRSHGRCTLRLHRSVGGKYGPNRDELYDLPFLPERWGEAVAPFSGDVDCIPGGGQASSATIWLVQDRPLPFRLAALVLDVDFGEK